MAFSDPINETIHQPVRLRIIAALVTLEAGNEVDSAYLHDLLQVTDGNLGAHLRKLEEAGYIAVTKTFVARKPRTFVAVAVEGQVFCPPRSRWTSPRVLATMPLPSLSGAAALSWSYSGGHHGSVREMLQVHTRGRGQGGGVLPLFHPPRRHRGHRGDHPGQAYDHDRL